MIDRLAADHKKAKEIGVVLSQLPIIKTVELIETNIIIFELNADVDETAFVQNLADKNIKIIGMGGGKLRMVTHLDYTDEMQERVLSLLKNL